MKSSQKISYPILILLLVVILSSGISFSRYSSVITNSGDSSTVIIVKEYNLDAAWTVPTTALQYPGMPVQTYDFTLQNTEAADLYYTIIIGLSWNAATPVIGYSVPLQMELYMVNADGSFTLVPTTSRHTILAGMEREHLDTQKALIEGNQSIDYRLRWSWGTTEADRNCSFSNKKIDISIDVNAEQ